MFRSRQPSEGADEERGGALADKGKADIGKAGACTWPGASGSAQDKSLSADSSRETISSSASEQHRASSAVEGLEEEFGACVYTEEDFKRFDALLDEDPGSRPTPGHLQSFKTYWLHKPVINYPKTIPSQKWPLRWREFSLEGALSEWMMLDQPYPQ